MYKMKLIKQFESLPMELVRHIMGFARPKYKYMNELNLIIKSAEEEYTRLKNMFNFSLMELEDDALMKKDWGDSENRQLSHHWNDYVNRFSNCDYDHRHYKLISYSEYFRNSRLDYGISLHPTFNEEERYDKKCDFAHWCGYFYRANFWRY